MSRIELVNQLIRFEVFFFFGYLLNNKYVGHVIINYLMIKVS